jgi:hypothetical protein
MPKLIFPAKYENNTGLHYILYSERFRIRRALPTKAEQEDSKYGLDLSGRFHGLSVIKSYLRIVSCLFSLKIFYVSEKIRYPVT